MNEKNSYTNVQWTIPISQVVLVKFCFKENALEKNEDQLARKFDRLAGKFETLKKKVAGEMADVDNDFSEVAGKLENLEKRSAHCAFQ